MYLKTTKYFFLVPLRRQKQWTTSNLELREVFLVFESEKGHGEVRIVEQQDVIIQMLICDWLQRWPSENDDISDVYKLTQLAVA